MTDIKGKKTRLIVVRSAGLLGTGVTFEPNTSALIVKLNIINSDKKPVKPAHKPVLTLFVNNEQKKVYTTDDIDWTAPKEIVLTKTNIKFGGNNIGIKLDLQGASTSVVEEFLCPKGKKTLNIDLHTQFLPPHHSPVPFKLGADEIRLGLDDDVGGNAFKGSTAVFKRVKETEDDFIQWTIFNHGYEQIAVEIWSPTEMRFRSPLILGGESIQFNLTPGMQGAIFSVNSSIVRHLQNVPEDRMKLYGGGKATLIFPSAGQIYVTLQLDGSPSKELKTYLVQNNAIAKAADYLKD